MGTPAERTGAPAAIVCAAEPVRQGIEGFPPRPVAPDDDDSVIASDHLAQAPDGGATACSYCDTNVDCGTNETCNSAGICQPWGVSGRA